jgi:hypothetical protein
MAAIRQKVSSRIERLLKSKALNDDQLLHLLFIFSREEDVKITRNQARRLLRLEKYSDATINQVVRYRD